MDVAKPAEPVVASWSGVGDHGHGVQFYAQDSTLAALLTSYVGSALISGGAAIVIATLPHRENLAACLRERGFDPDVPARQGRYLALDARETLSRFWRNGQLDVVRFHETVGDMLNAARAAVGNPRAPIAAFGEIVALLWMAGHLSAALQLEELWNGLLQAQTFSLCCAYPMGMFDGHDAGPFLRICAQHSHVFPAEQRKSSRIFTWSGEADSARRPR